MKRTVAEQLGGGDGIEALVLRFFRQMDERPEASTIRAMHRAETEPMVRRLSTFLTAWLQASPRRADTSIIPLAHFHFAIGPNEVEAWLACMEAALIDVQAEPAVASELMMRLAPLAELCRTDAAAGDF